jgi:hypothetical protein
MLLPALAGAQERIRDPEDEKEQPADAERVRDPEDAEDEGLAPARRRTAPPTRGLVGSLTGHFYSQLAVDTRHNDGPEYAAEWRNVLFLKAALEPSSVVRGVISGRFRHFTAADRDLGNPRHFWEADLWEAHIEVTLPGRVDVRVGNQIFHWGASDFLSPTDVLNPFDLRWGPLAEPDELKIPVFAVSATWRGPGVNVTGAWIPFVTPMRAFLVGHDFGLFQPRAYFATPDLRAFLSDPLSDAIQRTAFEGAVPSRSLANSQGAVRVWGTWRGIDWGASYIAGYEPFPAVRLDPDLARLLASAPSVDLALLGRVLERVQAGEPVLQATYNRRQVMGFDLTAALGPLLLRVEGAYAPLQTTYVVEAGSVVPVRRPAVTYAAALEYRYQEDVFVLAQWIHLATAARGTDRLFIANPNLQAIFFDVRWRLLGGDVELEVAGLGGVSQGDLVLTGTAAYRLSSRVQVMGGVSIFQGAKEGPGGYWDANDFVFVRLRVRL